MCSKDSIARITLCGVFPIFIIIKSFAKKKVTIHE